jgi:hypothetical protein
MFEGERIPHPIETASMVYFAISGAGNHRNKGDAISA